MVIFKRKFSWNDERPNFPSKVYSLLYAHGWNWGIPQIVGCTNSTAMNFLFGNSSFSRFFCLYRILPHFAGILLYYYTKILRKISYNMRNLGRFEIAITQPIEIPSFVGFLKTKPNNLRNGNLKVNLNWNPSLWGILTQLNLT